MEEITNTKPEDQITEEGQSADDQSIEIEQGQRKIIWQAKDFSIREFQTMKHDGDLILQPEYQRNFVATNQIAIAPLRDLLI